MKTQKELKKEQKDVQESLRLFVQDSIGEVLMSNSKATEKIADDYIKSAQQNVIIEGLAQIVLDATTVIYNSLINMGVKLPGGIFIDAMQQARDRMLCSIFRDTIEKQETTEDNPNLN